MRQMQSAMLLRMLLHRKRIAQKERQKRILRLQRALNQINKQDTFLSARVEQKRLYIIRGCTGFDGDLEIMEAIDGPGPSKKLELNINADEKLAYAA